MEKVILLALLMPFTAFGQVMENFESGNLNNWVQSTEDRWKADTTGSISGFFSLHHIYDNPGAGTDIVGLPVRDLHPDKGITKWSFLIRHGYDPSSSNNWAVFLMSDREPSAISVDGGTNGFAIGVNLSGSDDSLRLIKVKGDILTTIVNCRINWQTTVGISEPVKILVERSPAGIWTVSVLRPDENVLGTTSGTDNELFSPSWFGIFYRYSSSRDRLLWIDDVTINGTFYGDTEAPVINSCEATGKKSVEITFNEPPAGEFMVPENLLLNQGANRVFSVNKINDLTYDIIFADTFINKSLNNLVINKICDISTNCTLNSSISFTPVWAVTGDVVISEIMADPLPEVSLPGKEYLEISNRTGYAFNLKNWKLNAADQSYHLNEKIIGPHEIMILCQSSDTSLFQKYGSVTGLKQFPVLTDEGKIICLTDSSGNLIHGVEYSSRWYGNDLKSGGGWSLEMRDTGFPFYGEENWTASVSKKGGTPGMINSVTASNPDNSFYGISNLYPEDSLTITISFSEPVFCMSEMIKNFKLGDKGIAALYPVDPLFRKFVLVPEEQLYRGKIYELKLPGNLTDFAGNRMPESNKFVGLPEPAKPGDILFNELLFNPLPGDKDYIELFNCSGNILDASRLNIVSTGDEGGDMSQIYPVSEEKRCIMPGSYYAITTDRKRISERYFSADPDFIFEMGNLPPMSDDKGHLVLYNREFDRLDEVIYNEKMHYSLLSSFEGISLEKTSPRQKSEEAVNWHSASESSGWGTPGAPNSIYVEIPAKSDIVSFSSARISPDNDGYEDFLVMCFNLTGNNNVVSVMVFDETGKYVKKIASNLFAGTGATLIWDGTSEDGSLVSTGIYIIFITLFDDTGKTHKWKKLCTVIRSKI
jgi:hypothetical protein